MDGNTFGGRMIIFGMLRECFKFAFKKSKFHKKSSKNIIYDNFKTCDI